MQGQGKGRVLCRVREAKSKLFVSRVSLSRSSSRVVNKVVKFENVKTNCLCYCFFAPPVMMGGLVIEMYQVAYETRRISTHHTSHNTTHQKNPKIKLEPDLGDLGLVAVPSLELTTRTGLPPTNLAFIMNNILSLRTRTSIFILVKSNPDFCVYCHLRSSSTSSTSSLKPPDFDYDKIRSLKPFPSWLTQGEQFSFSPHFL